MVKKNLIFASIITLLLGCSKNEDQPTPFRKTELSNSTWRIASYLGTDNKTEFYKYLHFNSDYKTVVEYTADIGESNIANGKTTYPCQITFGINDPDFFVIQFPDGNTGTGFTTHNVNKITYENNSYDKVN